MAALGSMLIIFMALAVPIGTALAGASILYILYDPMLSPVTVFRAFFSFLNSYTLMAVPFFIYAGFLMEKTGLIAKLFQLADAIVSYVIFQLTKRPIEAGNHIIAHKSWCRILVLIRRNTC